MEDYQTLYKMEQVCKDADRKACKDPDLASVFKIDTFDYRGESGSQRVSIEFERLNPNIAQQFSKQLSQTGLEIEDSYKDMIIIKQEE